MLNHSFFNISLRFKIFPFSLFLKYYQFRNSNTDILLDFTNIMHTEPQLHKKYLTATNNKTQSISSVFQLIRKKKYQLSKELLDNAPVEGALPFIKLKKQKEEMIDIQIGEEADEEHVKVMQNQYNTPLKNYKTILNVGESQQKQFRLPPVSHLPYESKKKQYETIDHNQKSFNLKSDRYRVKTDITHVQRKLTEISSLQIQMRKFKEEENFQLRIKQVKNVFCQQIEKVPKNMKQRNQSNLNKPIECLQMFNPFFGRNNRIVSICLMKIGKIVFKDSSLLYKMGDEPKHFYIILFGKVKIVNGGLRRICQTGQTVLQQILYCQKNKKIALERAKTIGPTYLIQLSIEEYKKMREQLIRHGYKLGLQQMQAIIKRNYIVKNWLRNKIRLQSNK